MSAQNKKDLPLQGDRTLRSRREGSAVPAPLPSSSHDGPSVACPAGATEEIASAMIGGSSLGKAKRPGPASTKRDAMRTSPYLAPLVERLRTSRASSPTPSIMSNATTDIQSDTICVTDVEDDSSVDFDLSTMSTRKRGRPPTTGEYVGLASAKLRLVEAEKKMSDLEETKRILDPSSSLPEKIRVSTDNMIERYMEDLREAPLEDLTARAFEAMNQVIKVACVSKGLKGTLIKELKTAACKTSASLAIMASKSARRPAQEVVSESFTLVKELEEAKKEIRNLKEEIRSLRSRAAELPAQDLRDVPSTSRTLRSRATRNTSPTMEEAEEALLKRFDGLFNKWCEKKFGSLVPNFGTSNPNFDGMEAETEISAVPLSSGRQKPSKGGTKKSSVSAPQPASEKSGKKSGSTAETSGKADRDKDRSRMPPPVSLSRKKTSGESAETSAVTRSTESWTAVVGRKARKKTTISSSVEDKKKTLKARKSSRTPVGRKQGNSNAPVKSAGKKKAANKRKPPRAAAVVINCPPDKSGDVLRLAKSKIDLASLGISQVRPRRAATGAQMYEVSGPEGSQKADVLAQELSKALEGLEGVTIQRPVKMAEIRIRGLDDSATAQEVMDALAGATSCQPTQFKLGVLRLSGDGLRTVWVQCPLHAANKLASEGRVQVGWTKARVELLAARPLQCFRCLQSGHVRQRCPCKEDRSGNCFRCGSSGHKVADCTSPAVCPVCKKVGRPSNHRLGGRACPAKSKAGKIVFPDKSPSIRTSSVTTAMEVDGQVPLEQSSKEPMVITLAEGSNSLEEAATASLSPP
ncbi:uncharacterized protein [Cardiocondyla obscurior]|uniref:uncharacterized protein n=2 Tax=Cardiocondyla obscurior TaxID=286306 RepID=UPI003965743B